MAPVTPVLSGAVTRSVCVGALVLRGARGREADPAQVLAHPRELFRVSVPVIPRRGALCCHHHCSWKGERLCGRGPRGLCVGPWPSCEHWACTAQHLLSDPDRHTGLGLTNPAVHTHAHTHTRTITCHTCSDVHTQMDAHKTRHTQTHSHSCPPPAPRCHSHVHTDQGVRNTQSTLTSREVGPPRTQPHRRTPRVRLSPGPV